MNKEITNPIKIERAHRLRRPRELPQENPRNIIVHFTNWEDKNQLWQNLRGKSPIELEGNHMQFFQDLSQETLSRRRALKPLLVILRENQVQYNWGFPSCLAEKMNTRLD